MEGDKYTWTYINIRIVKRAFLKMVPQHSSTDVKKEEQTNEGNQ